MHDIYLIITDSTIEWRDELIGFLNKKQKEKSDIKIIHNKYGKPFINSEWKFSISHSNHLQGIALSRKSYNIGIDLQYIYPFSKEDMWEILSDFEKSYYEYHLINIKELFLIWTVKEAYLKYLGLGLYKSYKDVSVINKNGKYILFDKEKRCKENLIVFCIDAVYICAICYDFKFI